MPKCRFCDHANPAGIDRCENCGAWVEQKAGPMSEGAERQDVPAPEPGSLEAQVLAFMAGGKKIEAVKYYRKETGCDLKNAKDAVEALAAKHGIVAKGAGCAGADLVMALALGALGIGLAGDLGRPTPPTGQEGTIVADVARLESSNEKDRADAVHALVNAGRPAAPALVKALSNPRNDVRACAAEALQSILAVDPTSAPNCRRKADWEQRLTQLEVGMPLEEVLGVLLPEVSPADRLKRSEGSVGGGGGTTGSYRLDDYWVIVLYLIDERVQISKAGGRKNFNERFDQGRLSATPPVLERRVRQVWIAPPEHYTGTWVTWHVNGQKAHESEYRNGQYDGTVTAFRDDGSKCYGQHYTNGRLSGK